MKWNDLIKGIRCSRYTMKRERMRWECTLCQTRSADAHQQVLYELAMLTENRITNKLAREFLGVHSADVTFKLLERGPFKVAGKNRGAYYRHIDLIPFLKSDGYTKKASLAS